MPLFRGGNSEQHLGIRIPTTVRLRKFWFKPAHLLMTLYKTVQRERLTESEFEQFREDAKQQRLTLLKHGFHSGEDCFQPVYDKRTRQYVAMLLDFGTLFKLSRKQRVVVDEMVDKHPNVWLRMSRH